MSGLKQSIEVVYTADDAYVAPLVASLASLFSNAAADDGVTASIISCGITDVHKKQIEAMSTALSWKLRWYELDPQRLHELSVGQLNAAAVGSSTTYARLFLAEVLPQDLGRVIYIDPDTIVRSSLSSLWQQVTSGMAIAAVPEFYCPTVSGPMGVPDWQELGLNSDAVYFNAGVMLLDLCSWREQRIGENAIKYAEERRKTIFMVDQEALNAVIGGRLTVLDPVWNVTSYWRNPERRVGPYKNLIAGARIRHFTGPHKPWLGNGGCLPHADEFYRYLSQTTWSDYYRKPKSDNGSTL